MFSSHLKLTIASALFGSLVACAPPRAGTATITAADAPRSEAAEAADGTSSVTPRESARASSATDTPSGQLVCRARASDGTTELYLDWAGKEARGILRTIAPSGMVTDLKVHAERHKSMIIADDVAATDLVAHAATVVDDKGKRRIRLEEMGQARWADCE